MKFQSWSPIFGEGKERGSATLMLELVQGFRGILF